MIGDDDDDGDGDGDGDDDDDENWCLMISLFSPSSILLVNHVIFMVNRYFLCIFHLVLPVGCSTPCFAGARLRLRQCQVVQQPSGLQAAYWVFFSWLTCVVYLWLGCLCSRARSQNLTQSRIFQISTMYISKYTYIYILYIYACGHRTTCIDLKMDR